MWSTKPGSFNGAGSEDGTVPEPRQTILVCVGPSPSSAKVVREGQLIASWLGASWIAAAVETSRLRDFTESQTRDLMSNMRLAEHLGAETVTLAGDDVAEEIVRFARSRNAARIIIGRSREPRWRSVFRPNIDDRVLRLSGDIDVYIVHSADEGASPSHRLAWDRHASARYGGALGMVVLAALIAWLFLRAGLSQANQAIVFLPAAVLSAIWWGLGPGIFASVASVLLFDFLLVPPQYTLAVRDVESVITLVVMAGVALLVGTLAARLRRQIRTSRAREERLDVLFRLSRALAGASGPGELASAAEQEAASIFGRRVRILFVDRTPADASGSSGGEESESEASAADREAAAWAFANNRPAGRGTSNHAHAISLFLPIGTFEGVVGLLAVEVGDEPVALSPENRHLLETIAAQIAAAVERDRLLQERSRALLEAETERLRSSLLSSVSHDLRTPLAVITGATSSLLEMGDADQETQQMLLSEAYEESNRLSRLVDNLLIMTRLDSGVIVVDKQWFPLEDVIGSALGRLKNEIGQRVISKSLPNDLPLVPLDGVLVEQVLFNLLDNALKYTPSDTPIEVTARATEDEVIVQVADRGPGIEPDEQSRVFDKLYRGTASRGSTRGAGLGLAIAGAVVEAHGGRMGVANRPDGGALFWFALPLEPAPADLAADATEECQ